MKKFFIFSFLCMLIGFGFAPSAYSQDNECVINTLPFTEGFESVNSGLPNCFTRNPLGIYQANNTIQPYVDSYQSHSGSNSLRAFNNSYTESSPNVPTLIFPELGAQFDMANMVLEFWAYTAWNTSPYFVVGVMDDPEDLSTFTTVQTVSTSSSDSYTKFTIYFTQYFGVGRHIAIKFANTPGVFGSMCIDDISLTQSAECGPVQYLSLDNINGNEATILWHPNAVGTANWYNVSLVNMDNGGVEISSNTTDTTFTFAGLAYSTHYRAFVSVNCTDGLASSSDSVDFSTLIQPVTVPYFQNFEGDTTDFAPYFSLSGNGGNQWYFGSATGVPSPDATITHSLYISSDNGLTNTYNDEDESNAYAVFNVTFPSEALEYHLSFDYRVNGFNSGYMAFDYLSVYLLEADQQIPMVGEPDGTALLFEASSVNSWTHFDAIIENAPGTSKQVVFYWYNFGLNISGEDLNPPAAIDNISIAGISCAQPNLLTATNITTDSATLSWNEAGSATSWTVYYRPESSTGSYTAVPVVDTPSTILTNLIANTQYEFYVVADCGGGELSNPSNIASFRTACGPIEVLPFTENFENGLYPTIQSTYVACWDRLTTDATHYVYVGYGDYYAHDGEYYLDFGYTPECSDIAIMPELGENINASDLMITFYACHTSYGYSGTLGTLEFGVMTDKSNAATFVPVQTVNLLGQEAYDYSEQMISLANYTGNGKYLAFRVSNCDGTSYYIDDILLEQRPDCMYPLEFHKSNVTNQSVTLEWTEFGDATSWLIQFDTTGFTLGQGMTVAANSTIFTINGLTNLTSYDFYVQSDCGDSQSEWVGPVTAVTGVISMPFNSNETLTTCNAILCDDGGIDGEYSAENISSVVIYPETETFGLEITGTADIHPGYNDWGASHLIFYEGEGFNGPVLGDYTGYNLDIAIASSEPITVFFISDYFTASGFALNIKCAACTPPSNFSVTNVESSSAILSWAGGSGHYILELSGDTNAIITTFDTAYQLSGLVPNSNYNVRVRCICGTDTSFYSPTISFSTSCEAITVTEDTPWTEDFEGYIGTGSQPFQCWTRAIVDVLNDAPFVYCGNATACHSGVNSAELIGNANMLVLPEFTNDIHELRLSFWATSTNPTFGTLEVGVVTDPNNPNSFEFVAFTGLPGPRGLESSGNGNFMGPFDFYGVQATNGRIALRYTDSYGYASWNLDDFTVEIAPSCIAPSNIDVGNVSATGATVLWANVNNETQWALQYKKSSETDWSADILCTSTNHVLTNLIPATQYQVRIKSVCSVDDESDWSAIEEFMTLSGTVVTEPTVITSPADDITQHTATLHGAITEPGNQTIIARGFEWKAVGDDNYTQVTTGNSNILLFGLTNLNANSSYTYRAFATTANMTTYGDDEIFTTLPDDSEPCEAPTNLDATEVTTNSITFDWTDHSDAYGWNVAWTWGSSLAGPVITSNKPYTIVDLQPNTTYTIRVQTICAGIGESEWSEPLTVTTLGVGIDDYLTNSISLYPNPANDVVNVQCTMNNVQVEAIEVFDVYGKLLQTVSMTPETTRINVSGLAAGIYFVRVTTNEGNVTKSFVKK